MSLGRSRARKVGLPPGSLVHVGESTAEPARISLMHYTEGGLEECSLLDAAALAPYREREGVTWVDVCGVHDVELVGRFGQLLGIHPLVQEDIVNTHQRAKTEDYEDHLFVVVRMIRYDPEQGLDAEQVSLVLGPGCVITFQERPGDVFDPVRERVRRGKGRIRKAGPDYLAYALIDVIVDHYFLAVERIGEEIEDLEEALLESPEPDVVRAIHELRRELVTLRKAVWPVREAVLALERSESELVEESVQPYLRDVYDHTVQVIDAVESYRDILTGYLDLYLSSVSNRMNEVMKVLTIIATLFIPLTFVVGVYGMNFQYMPELGWRWAYPAVWAVMLALAAVMLFYFRRKGWLGG